MPLSRRVASRRASGLTRATGTSVLVTALVVTPMTGVTPAPAPAHDVHADPAPAPRPLPEPAARAATRTPTDEPSPAAPAPAPASPASGLLVGWDLTRDGVAGEPLTDTVVVAPADGRVAQVQQEVGDDWVVRSEIALDDTTADLVDVTLPSGWARAPLTRWRLHLPATDDAPALTSLPQRVRTTWPLSTDPADRTVLVNKQHPVDPPRWAPDQLVVPRNAGAAERVGLVPEAAAAMEDLARAARRATGHRLVMVSGHRSAAYQEKLFDRYAAEHGTAAAERFSAHAGESEHQTGWAADVTQDDTPFTRFGSTRSADWVAAHAWRHGWVVRYTPGTEDITGYRPEPWHLRYVGPDLAAYLHRTGVTLEEAVGAVP